MNIDMGFDFGFGFAWGCASACTLLWIISLIAKGCFSLGNTAVKWCEKKKNENIAQDYCSNPFRK